MTIGANYAFTKASSVSHVCGQIHRDSHCASYKVKLTERACLCVRAFKPNQRHMFAHNKADFSS